MNQYDATAACPSGMHLPTIRELAAYSQTNGAKGIRQWTEPPTEPPGEYQTIFAVNQVGPLDQFYFFNKGYKCPPGAPDGACTSSFWSSSVYAKNRAIGYTLSMYGDTVGDYRDDSANTAVWCFPSL